MPLIIKSEDALPEAAEAPVTITEPTYRGITVDTRYTPQEALMTVIEGSSWVVDYYSQVLDDDSYVNGQMTNTDPVFQQYILVKHFELKVSSPLAASQNDESKEMTLIGSAAVHPKLTPNVGDMFLADIGDGREGIFKITSSERRSIFKDTAHVVDYELISYSTDQRRADLDAKTIKTTYYVKDNNFYGQNPIVEEEDYFLTRDLKVQLQTLTEVYFRKFFSREYQTLIMPGEEEAVYDHFLLKAVKSTFNTNEERTLQYLRQLNVSDDDTMQCFTLWDCVINRDEKLRLHAFRQYGLVSARSFTIEPMMESVYYSGVDKIIYPRDNEISVDYEIYSRRKPLLEDSLAPSTNLTDDFAGALSDLQKEGLPYGDNPFFYTVTVDDYYVLSENFYTGSEQQSKFELAVRDHIKGYEVNRKLLKAFCELQHLLGAKERFYYIPLLILMIKAALKDY